MHPHPTSEIVRPSGALRAAQDNVGVVGREGVPAPVIGIQGHAVVAGVNPGDGSVYRSAGMACVGVFGRAGVIGADRGGQRRGHEAQHRQRGIPISRVHGGSSCYRTCAKARIEDVRREEETG